MSQKAPSRSTRAASGVSNTTRHVFPRADQLADRAEEVADRSDMLEGVAADGDVGRKREMPRAEMLGDEPQRRPRRRSGPDRPGRPDRFRRRSRRPIRQSSARNSPLPQPISTMRLPAALARRGDLAGEIAREGVEGLGKMLRFLEIRRVGHRRLVEDRVEGEAAAITERELEVPSRERAGRLWQSRAGRSCAAVSTEPGRWFRSRSSARGAGSGDGRRSLAGIACQRTPSYDVQARDRHDELASAFPVRRLLGDDLLTEVPRQDHHVVGPVIDQPARIADLQPHARHVLAVLVDVLVDDILDGAVVEAKVVEHDRALGGGAVGGDALAVRP